MITVSIFLLVSKNRFLPSNKTPTERIETVYGLQCLQLLKSSWLGFLVGYWYSVFHPSVFYCQTFQKVPWLFLNISIISSLSSTSRLCQSLTCYPGLQSWRGYLASNWVRSSHVGLSTELRVQCFGLQSLEIIFQCHRVDSNFCPRQLPSILLCFLNLKAVCTLILSLSLTFSHFTPQSWLRTTTASPPVLADSKILEILALISLVALNFKYQLQGSTLLRKDMN